MDEEECVVWTSGHSKDRWGSEEAAWAYIPDIHQNPWRLTESGSSLFSNFFIFISVALETYSEFQITKILSGKSNLNSKSRDIIIFAKYRVRNEILIFILSNSV